jgi:hypothetical protein
VYLIEYSIGFVLESSPLFLSLFYTFSRQNQRDIYMSVNK